MRSDDGERPKSRESFLVLPGCPWEITGLQAGVVLSVLQDSVPMNSRTFADSAPFCRIVRRAVPLCIARETGSPNTHNTY